MNKETIKIPAGSPGSHSELTLWRYQGETSGPKVYLQAALHADEWPGLLAIHHLHQLLQQQQICGEILIVPYANPVGMRQFLGGYQLGRFDFDYSGNFNRGYLDLAHASLPYLQKTTLDNAPSTEQIRLVRRAFKQALDNWQPQLESDSLRKQLQLLSYDADYVLDIHCDAQACVHAFVNQRHQDLGEILATALDAQALILEDDPGGMAFDEAAASPWWRLAQALDIKLPYPTFATTIELRGERDVNDNFAQQDANNILRFLGHIGAISNQPSIEVKQNIATPLAGVGRITAPHTGLVIYQSQTGDYVEQGALIAELIQLDDPDQARTPLYAPTSGIIYALGRNHLVRLGHVVAQIAGQKPLGDGQLMF